LKICSTTLVDLVNGWIDPWKKNYEQQSGIILWMLLLRLKSEL